MGISPIQIALVLVLGVLIFGKNLPDVAKQIGAGLMEFKKGLNEMRDISHRDRGTSVGHSLDKEESDEAMEDTEKHSMLGAKFEPPN